MNLIGEHIDYYGLPVLPMAIQRRLTVDFEPNRDGSITLHSSGFGTRTLQLAENLQLSGGGDWANYLKAAVGAVRERWQVQHGFQAQVTSNLPPAAGLSSSSALLTACTLVLLRVNGLQPSLDELMSVLPEAEHFVGTRGGGMDHAAVLASRSGQASWLHFCPFSVDHVPIPDDWCFLLAHSLVRAEKSGPAKARYNACRTAGLSALTKAGFTTYRDALQALPSAHATATAQGTEDERNTFLHVVSEARRVTDAVACLRAADRPAFGQLLIAGHASLRDRLKVSCPALDRIVEIAADAGADGARLTGAGFGGCAIVLCAPSHAENIAAALERHFYSGHAEYRRQDHLFQVQPSNGALYADFN